MRCPLMQPRITVYAIGGIYQSGKTVVYSLLFYCCDTLCMFFLHFSFLVHCLNSCCAWDVLLTGDGARVRTLVVV